MEERIELTDNKVDILSHPKRRSQIHILTIDPILAEDVVERLSRERRLKRYDLLYPRAADVRSGVEELEAMAQDTTASRLIIFDVRRVTIPRLRRPFNTIVGYNRRDFNSLCYTLCIGDGPVNLYQNGRATDLFVPHLASHRTDYYPAAYFFDPFLHYEPGEIMPQGVEDFEIPHEIPRRLAPYFKDGTMEVETVRRYFRGDDKDEETQKKRGRLLRHIYKKRIAEQFPDRAEEFRDLLTRRGLQMASEKLNLYPLYFEDWVCELVRKARRNAAETKG